MHLEYWITLFLMAISACSLPRQESGSDNQFIGIYNAQVDFKGVRTERCSDTGITENEFQWSLTKIHSFWMLNQTLEWMRCRPLRRHSSICPTFLS
jgi:hypothetical protein